LAVRIQARGPQKAACDSNSSVPKWKRKGNFNFFLPANHERKNQSFSSSYGHRLAWHEFQFSLPTTQWSFIVQQPFLSPSSSLSHQHVMWTNGSNRITLVDCGAERKSLLWFLRFVFYVIFVYRCRFFAHLIPYLVLGQIEILFASRFYLISFFMLLAFLVSFFSGTAILRFCAKQGLSEASGGSAIS
jgi:hypothetical protein